jgi:hypothetical protein
MIRRNCPFNSGRLNASACRPARSGHSARPRFTPAAMKSLQCKIRKAGNICSLRGVPEPTIDATLGNDAESATQSIVVTQEFFRLVFVLIAPQNEHRRLSPKNPGKPHIHPIS